MPEEQTMSPEEKLLRVIQSKKTAAAPPPAAAPVVAQTSDPAGSQAPTVSVGVTAGKGAERAKLQVVAVAQPPASAKNNLSVDDGPDTTAILVADEALGKTADGVVEAGGVAGGRKRRRVDGVVRSNRVLVLAVALIVLLIGVQIWANFSGRPLPEAADGEMLLPTENPQVEQVPPAELTKAFETTPWFPAEAPKVGSGPNPPPQPLPRQGLKLVAVSVVAGQMEAIIVDTVPNKMHFLRVGDKMLTGQKGAEKEFKLVRVEKDHAVLSDGTEEIKLK